MYSFANTGVIRCTHCQRVTKKVSIKGYCFPCFKNWRSATAALSVLKCHLHLGTCREPDWAETHCQTDHIVYLANSSGESGHYAREPNADALVRSKVHAGFAYCACGESAFVGLFEVLCKAFVADKTDWRALLRTDAQVVDLYAVRERLLQDIQQEVTVLQNTFGLQSVNLCRMKVSSVLYTPCSVMRKK